MQQSLWAKEAREGQQLQLENKDIRDLEHLPAPIILLGNFNAHNPLLYSVVKKMSTKRRMLEKSTKDTTSCAFNKKRRNLL